jgi:lipase ATG15
VISSGAPSNASLLRGTLEKAGDTPSDEERNAEEAVDGLSPERVPKSSTDSEAEEEAISHQWKFQDHYSLGLTPSSHVTFRGRKVHVCETHDEQFLLEEVATEEARQNDHDGATTTILVRRFASTSFGQSALRVTYTLVAMLVTGFLFVFCLQMVIFVVMNLPVESGATSISDIDGSVLAGTFLTIPLLLHGMSSTMAMATTFVIDTWRGGPLVRSITGWSIVVREWVAFAVFLGIPSLTIIALLFAGRTDWWEMSARVWVICVGSAMAVFSIAVVYREVSTCLKLVKQQSNKLQTVAGGKGAGTEINAPLEEQETSPSEPAWKQCLEVVHRAFLLTQTYRFSGTKQHRYTIYGENEALLSGFQGYTLSDAKHVKPVVVKIGWYSHMTQLSCCGCLFERLDKPERFFTAEEIRDVEPFLTRYNWSLEKMCCRDSRRSTVIAAQGPAALQNSQIWSSLACSILASLIVLLLITGSLVWLNTDKVVIALIAVLCLLCCLLPMVKDSYSLYRTYEGIYNIRDTEEDQIFQVWETLCISRPRARLCYMIFIFEIVLFFIWPLGTLYANNTNSVATVFFVLGFFTCFRIYFDPSAVLARTGMVPIYSSRSARNSINKLVSQAQISEIIGKITQSPSVGRWMWVFGILVLMLYLMFLSVVNSDSDVSPSDRPEIILLPDFYYPPQQSLAYPSCELTKGFRFPPEINTTHLLDFAFLSACKSPRFVTYDVISLSFSDDYSRIRRFIATVAYEDLEISQSLLDTWFGQGVVQDEAVFVARYREETNTAKVPVWFKLFSFPSIPGFGIVSIRGSETTIDWLVNVQLWFSSGMAQLVMAFVPFGWIWKPIIDDLVRVVSAIQSESLKEVSYYNIVRNFCLEMLAGLGGTGQNYTVLRLTGASLGGGTAIIAGAQAGIPTVAISGPNAVIGRRTFEPPVTMDQLNNLIIDIVPDSDIIAHIGGQSRLFQRIRCTGPSNDLFACHSMWRTTCELAYSCGTNGRPALCMCVERFGYPEPIQNGTITFEEACGAQS